MSPWKPTHKIKLENGDQIEVMEHEGAGYTRDEWDAEAPADFERDDDGRWTFQGQAFTGTVEAI